MVAVCVCESDSRRSIQLFHFASNQPLSLVHLLFLFCACCCSSLSLSLHVSMCATDGHRAIEHGPLLCLHFYLKRTYEVHKTSSHTLRNGRRRSRVRFTVRPSPLHHTASSHFASRWNVNILLRRRSNRTNGGRESEREEEKHTILSVADDEELR